MKRFRQGFTIVEIMIVVAIIGILIAIAVPGFQKARTESRKRGCLENLTRIDSAKEQWALENKVAVGIECTVEDVNKHMVEVPTCPAGGTYTINKIGENPTCSVHGSLDTPSLTSERAPSRLKEGSIALKGEPNVLQELERKKIVVEISPKVAESLKRSGRAEATILLVP